MGTGGAVEKRWGQARSDVQGTIYSTELRRVQRGVQLTAHINSDSATGSSTVGSRRAANINNEIFQIQEAVLKKRVKQSCHLDARRASSHTGSSRTMNRKCMISLWQSNLSLVWVSLKGNWAAAAVIHSYGSCLVKWSTNATLSQEIVPAERPEEQFWPAHTVCLCVCVYVLFRISLHMSSEVGGERWLSPGLGLFPGAAETSGKWRWCAKTQETGWGCCGAFRLLRAPVDPIQRHGQLPCLLPVVSTSAARRAAGTGLPWPACLAAAPAWSAGSRWTEPPGPAATRTSLEAPRTGPTASGWRCDAAHLKEAG